MLIDYLTGIRRNVRDAVGQALIDRRLARPVYMTRDITAIGSGGLNDLDLPALHALAKQRGVAVHHRAGADKVRAALIAGKA